MVSLLLWAKVTRRPALLVIGAISLIVGGLIFFTPGGDTLRINRIDSSVARINNWRESIGIFAKSPIIGSGFALTQIYGDDSAGKLVPSRTGAGIDSSLLFVLVGTGLLGVISFIYLLYEWAWVNHKRNSMVSMVLVVSMVSVLIHSIFVNSLFYPLVMVWLWILAGVREQER
jgi:O-antigen ligase